MLLVSPDFLASQFILNKELPRILDHAKSGGVVLCWCLVKNCLWKETPLKGYQAAHAPAKVWNRLSQEDLLALLEEVGNKIKEAFEQSAAPLPVALEVPPPLPARPHGIRGCGASRVARGRAGRRSPLGPGRDRQQSVAEGRRDPRRCRRSGPHRSGRLPLRYPKGLAERPIRLRSDGGDRHTRKTGWDGTRL